ncbi:Glutathione S-transferase, partial [Araneus ventricosus]
ENKYGSGDPPKHL